MFPRQTVTPVIFGPATQEYDLDGSNQYVSQAAAQHGLPSFLVTTPEWTAQELEARVVGGGFLGLKPYLEWAPPHIPSDDITIFDFLPRHHLEVADAHGWIVMLHIPRRGRLRDPLNLEMMLEIEHRYPNVRLVIAHIGRAYCPEDVGDAFEILKDARRMHFDFCANTSAYAMEQLLRAVGPQRVVFGSDLPVVRMRMRRICEDGFYVNLVPPGLYGDVSDDPHMREVSDRGGFTALFLHVRGAAGLSPGRGSGRPERNGHGGCDVQQRGAADRRRGGGWAPDHAPAYDMHCELPMARSDMCPGKELLAERCFGTLSREAWHCHPDRIA